MESLRDTIFLVVGGGVVTSCSDTKGAFLEIILESEGEWTTEAKLVTDGAHVIGPYSRESLFHVEEDLVEVGVAGFGFIDLGV